MSKYNHVQSLRRSPVNDLRGVQKLEWTKNVSVTRGRLSRSPVAPPSPKTKGRFSKTEFYLTGLQSPRCGSPCPWSQSSSLLISPCVTLSGYLSRTICCLIMRWRRIISRTGWLWSWTWRELCGIKQRCVKSRRTAAYPARITPLSGILSPAWLSRYQDPGPWRI